MKRWRKYFFVIVGILFITFMFLWLLTGKWMKDGLTPVADGSNSYAVVLGAKVNGETPSLALKYRLDAALKYSEKHPQVRIILAGGQGKGESISEAKAMERYLVNNGFPKEQLILESRSTSTYENLKFSKELLPAHVNEITIISNDFHLARAQKIAAYLNLTSDVISAPTPKIVEFKLRSRERLALMKTFVIGY